LSYKKSFYHYLHHFLKSLQIEKKISKRSKNSPDFAENTDFSKKKSAIGKNPPF